VASAGGAARADRRSQDPTERLGLFPTFPSRLLRRDEQLARFTETMEWAFGEMERATTDQSANDGSASPDTGSGAHEGAT